MPGSIKLIKSWITEYFSKCNLKKTYEDNDELFLIAGHRGSPVFEPENTFSSFEKAVNDGANSLEVDVCITKDLEVVLWHDWDPDSTKALLREGGFEPFVKYKPHPPSLGNKYRKKISELTLAEFREHFTYKGRHDKAGVVYPVKPKLSEFFEWCIEQTRLSYIFLDIKTPDEEKESAIPIVEEIGRLIDKFAPPFKIVMETNQKKVFKLIRSKFPAMTISLDIEPRAGLILLPRQFSAVKKAIKYGNKAAVALRPRKVTIANWTTFRRIMKYDARLKSIYNKRHPERKVEKLIAATVNKYEELDCLVKLGLDGIQSDFPHRLKEIAEKHGRKTVAENTFAKKVW